MSGERTPLLSEGPSGSQTPVNSDPSQPSVRAPPTKRELIWILVALWSAVFLGALDGTVVATLVSPIGSHFNASHQASYLGTSYFLTVCCFTPLYGRLSDIIGRKAAMLLGLTLFGFGTLLCGLAPSMKTLIAARAIAGMGGGGIMTVSSVATSDLVPLKRRGLYQGLANIVYGTGAALGGPLGGFINDAIGWRWAFLLQLPILAVSFALIAFHVNISLPLSLQIAAQKSATLRSKILRIDFLGSLTLVTTVACFLVATTMKAVDEVPWSNPLVISLFTISAVSLVAFIVVEAKVAKEPILPMQLLTRRTPAATAVVNFTLSLVGYSVLYNIPLYFEAVRLQTSSQAGLHLLPNSFAVSLGSVAAGWVMRATGKYYKIAVGTALLSLGSALLMVRWDEHTSEWELWLDIIPSGFGLAGLVTIVLIALISSVSREEMAVATGTSYLFRTTGQVLGISLTGALAQNLLLQSLREKIQGPGAEELINKIRRSTDIIRTLDPATRRAAMDSWGIALRAVFIFNAAIAFICLLATLPLQEFHLPGTHEEHAENISSQGGSGNVTPRITLSRTNSQGVEGGRDSDY